MPILRDIQMGLREVGRIRCGDRVKSGNGTAPRKLERFRFTSDDPELLGVVADLYVGTVERWPDAPSGDQYQVYVTAERIPVMIVPGLAPITQWYESWSGGGCQRRCDGYRESISGKPCLCLEGDQVCKPTTRLSVILPEIRGIGLWRLESHGWYAARELGGTLELLERVIAATREPVSGTLRLTQRMQRVGGQTRRYAVPALELAATVPELAAAVAPQRPLEGPTIDASNAARVTALAQAAGPPGGPRGFPTDLEDSAARSRAKLERKRTPDLGPGRRGRTDLEERPQPDPEEIREAFASPITDKQLRAIMALFRSTGMSDRDERLAFAAKIIGRSISTSKDLTSLEASQVIENLQAVESGEAEFVTDDTGRITGARYREPAEVIDIGLPEDDG